MDDTFKLNIAILKATRLCVNIKDSRMSVLWHLVVHCLKYHCSYCTSFLKYTVKNVFLNQTNICLRSVFYQQQRTCISWNFFSKIAKRFLLQAVFSAYYQKISTNIVYHRYSNNEILGNTILLNYHFLLISTFLFNHILVEARWWLQKHTAFL